MSEEKQTVKNPLSKDKPGPGRPKGVPNKTTTQLKEAILQAATEAGGDEGLVGYLKFLAADSPSAFSSLLGKVLPMQISGEGGGAVQFIIRDMTKE